MSAHGSYSGPPQTLTVDGLLFDFDGTIVDSTDGMPLSMHPLWTNLLTISPNSHRQTLAQVRYLALHSAS